ncbi:hypothetical protein M569_03935 [Genlisea aurea]|uniref:DUF7032 domain-containing protein n=1 Tax=Genlisea aurea TaxID=192259 RepID=S8E4X1_9LAMI|nr:hypothetical protein M569_03935 [Genlisea aurea]
MDADGGGESPAFNGRSVEEYLSYARELIPKALEKAKEMSDFALRWKMIVSKLEKIPSSLSDFSTHPCFSKNALCKEQLQTICNTLNEVILLAIRCSKQKYEGKLRMQSDLDALSGKLDLNLRDCELLIKTGLLGDVSVPSPSPGTLEIQMDSDVRGRCRELLARLHIGHLDSKHVALDGLLEAMKFDEKNVLPVIRRSDISALLQLLITATYPRIREKAATIICSLSESGSFDDWLVSEGVLPPLIRLLESGSVVGKEKAVASLERLSISPQTARSIVGHGGVRPLIESVPQSAAVSTLRNLSAVAEIRPTLAEEGIVPVVIGLLSSPGISRESKDGAAECLQNLTSSSEPLKRLAIREGGIRALIGSLDFDGPSPPRDSAVVALRNLVGSVTTEVIVSSGLVSRLVHVMKCGSVKAQHAAASALCEISGSGEMKRLVGESGCIPILVSMLEAKGNSTREVAAQAMARLMAVPSNCREVKRMAKSVPNLVSLLDPNVENTAKKYAVQCLGMLSSSRRCRKMMISHGGIGYLRKLVEIGVPGADKLVDRLERKRFRSFFYR